ncbi:glycosyltransferase family 4 protein [Helicobacter ailurogastricus]|uniref:Undecaprenyl-phosphate N-acetylglucosaminyl 1-phosphate transferase n=2 Tax=Helicobacter ailurogastricus TaxID=1578720 RepID=A0A0K2XEB4_9HELI|nr:MraY family glycosyltransferase [Helicobacter ailurogastricus]CRF41174.1 Undecaprenyl-phosphate N-acetylglucosaminyl 1-phosphate transferase [Helicobacter ailurogastricus]CRF42204.1 Undecaprenyl-phosphate N-acetylglucosaminyl 1-phosphate transferase [Helicobacter ailurogastricus]CRF43918.1 Undecaprenyl-phosphate N-acetylglucosaminyl 1-phosphate transferase [Helicobacter ailurogastricus]
MPFMFGYFLLSFACVLGVVFYAKKSEIFTDNADKPQGFHTKKTPRAGGLGVFVVFVFSGGFLGVWGFLGGVLIFISGFLEDLNFSLSPKMRLILQSLGVFVVVLFAPLILKDFAPIFSLPLLLALPLSVFMLVGVVNAMNIIDGFHGLAGGLSCLALGFIYLAQPNPFILALLCGVLGFLVLNFPKGYIFLGDGGAYLLGFILGAALMDLALKGAASAWFGLALMIYPVTEVLFSITRRKLQKQKATMPDALHLHTLLFKALQKKPCFLNPNALTGLLVVLGNLPFMWGSFLCRHHPYGLLILIALFVWVYLKLYSKLKKGTTCA